MTEVSNIDAKKFELIVSLRLVFCLKYN